LGGLSRRRDGPERGKNAISGQGDFFLEEKNRQGKFATGKKKAIVPRGKDRPSPQEGGERVTITVEEVSGATFRTKRGPP